jgi:hypothetical protein
MKIFSLFELAKKELIGKELRVCTYSKTIESLRTKEVKKSANVTDKQFESGNPRFRFTHKYAIGIGRHLKFETFKIIGIQISYGDGYQSTDDLTLVLDVPDEFSNLKYHELLVTSELKQISKNVYTFNYE